MQYISLLLGTYQHVTTWFRFPPQQRIGFLFSHFSLSNQLVVSIPSNASLRRHSEQVLSCKFHVIYCHETSSIDICIYRQYINCGTHYAERLTQFQLLSSGQRARVIVVEILCLLYKRNDCFNYDVQCAMKYKLCRITA